MLAQTSLQTSATRKYLQNTPSSLACHCVNSCFFGRWFEEIAPSLKVAQFGSKFGHNFGILGKYLKWIIGKDFGQHCVYEVQMIMYMLFLSQRVDFLLRIDLAVEWGLSKRQKSKNYVEVCVVDVWTPQCFRVRFWRGLRLFRLHQVIQNRGLHGNFPTWNKSVSNRQLLPDGLWKSNNVPIHEHKIFTFDNCCLFSSLGDNRQY